MNPNTLINLIWVIGICITITLLSKCQSNIKISKDNALIEMVKNGADPQEASCAITNSSSKLCAVLIGKKTKE